MQIINVRLCYSIGNPPPCKMFSRSVSGVWAEPQSQIFLAILEIDEIKQEQYENRKGNRAYISVWLQWPNNK